MKKLFYLSLFLAVTMQLPAQVVISTDPDFDPGDAALTVDGSITVREKIYAGGDGVTLGNPGEPGQVLVSQGPDLPPRWRTLNVPTIEEDNFYLIYNNSFSDYRLGNGNLNPSPGYQFPGNIDVTTGSNGPYSYGSTRGSLTGFTTLTGLNKQFDVFSNQNQVYVTFEAIAQIDTGTSGDGVDFVCGIFVGKVSENKTLRGIRKATLYMGNAGQPFLTFTQITLADDLTIGKYDVEVACKRTANYNGYNGAAEYLGIGTAVSTNINNFIAQTSLKVEVYEIPENYNNILEITP